MFRSDGLQSSAEPLPPTSGCLGRIPTGTSRRTLLRQHDDTAIAEFNTHTG